MQFSKNIAVTSILSPLQLVAAAPEVTTRDLATTGDLTHYDVGLGACGWTNSDSELVVALGAPRFDPQTPNGNPNNNPLCGRMIKVNYGGKSVTAKVVDRCQACLFDDLDLSPAAFQALADLGLGRISGTWGFV
ncbi:RlpA-like double-psi beta-barrel-protein domain-containing protein-containing protein [Bombardia bombarda]|uniref:RlpA-like double-psi beta-barrel-protein domain-containing protein-containing protein n=1 Tax=Bombardia bombarda TaxID=252184 RepID=A0AA40C4V2_9PEZI|nr:RlpA-like double-psi beta-barrel-protein domain-containing protein-containing protein [Bombardia bombarda]